MKVSDILNEIKIAKGTNEKKRLLEVHKENSLLRTAIKYGLDPFTPFNVVKVPKVKDRKPVKEETETWLGFFEILQSLTTRTVTGNAAIDLVHSHFETVSREECQSNQSTKFGRTLLRPSMFLWHKSST
jgi:hypothetical protein